MSTELSNLPPQSYFDERDALALLVPRAKLLAALADAYAPAGAAVPVDIAINHHSEDLPMHSALPAAPAAVAGPAREEIAVLRAEHGITSSGRGVKEFEQVDAFVRAVLQRWGAAPQAPAAPSTHAGLLAAAAHIQAKAQAHLDERGSYDPDTGAVEMSDANQEHFNTLDELADEIRMMADKAAPASCDRPPAGWTCSRASGHDGPCAAAPAAPAVGPSAELADYQGPDDTPHPVLVALSEHDSPCDDTAEAIARIAALRAEIKHLRPFLLRAQAHQEAETDRLAECLARPSATTLNVLRVALERGNMPYRATGFKDHEIATAAEWVRAAQAAAKGAA